MPEDLQPSEAEVQPIETADTEAPDRPAEPVSADAAAADPGEEPAVASPAEPQLRTRRGGSDRRTNLIVIGFAALAVVLFAAMGYGTVTKRLDAARKADSATALIEKADVIVVQVDTVVRSEVTSSLAEPAKVAAARVPEATQQLERAIELLEQGRAGNNLDDRQRTDPLMNAAKARLEMMQLAPAILRLNQAAAEALTPAREGWDQVIAADKKSDQAVAEYNRLTTSGVRRSSTLNNQVATELASARVAFEQAERLFPEAPFEAYIAYVDARIALNALSRQSDAAWLKGDKAKANSITASYNAQDARAIQQAKALPESPEKAIATAFETAGQGPMEAYYKARDAATDADKALRE